MDLFQTLCFCLLFLLTKSSLFIQKNEKRSFDLLDGLWTFIQEPFNSHGIGIENEWFKKDLMKFEVKRGQEKR